MSDVKQALNQDSVIPKNRIEEARNVEFLADFKGFKKGDKTIMHFTGAELLLSRYPKSVKVTELDEKAELKKAKEVAGTQEK